MNLSRRSFLKAFLGVAAAATIPVGLALWHTKKDVTTAFVEAPASINSSICLIGWGGDKVHGIYPKGDAGRHTEYVSEMGKLLSKGMTGESREWFDLDKARELMQ